MHLMPLAKPTSGAGWKSPNHPPSAPTAPPPTPLRFKGAALAPKRTWCSLILAWHLICSERRSTPSFSTRDNVGAAAQRSYLENTANAVSATRASLHTLHIASWRQGACTACARSNAAHSAPHSAPRKGRVTQQPGWGWGDSDLDSEIGFGPGTACLLPVAP